MTDGTLLSPWWLTSDMVTAAMLLIFLLPPLVAHKLVMAIGHGITPPARHSRQHGRRPLK